MSKLKILYLFHVRRFQTLIILSQQNVQTNWVVVSAEPIVSASAHFQQLPVKFLQMSFPIRVVFQQKAT